ncbi:MAG TPA: hypothetical protein VGP45_03860, partial [Marinobacter sp.]|nr:hypothetical protein [Marinobacter sp.]
SGSLAKILHPYGSVAIAAVFAFAFYYPHLVLRGSEFALHSAVFCRLRFLFRHRCFSIGSYWFNKLIISLSSCCAAYRLLR